MIPRVLGFGNGLLSRPGGVVGPGANTEEFVSVSVLSFGIATQKVFPAFPGVSLDFQEGFPTRKRLAEAGIHNLSLVSQCCVQFCI